MEIPPFIHFRDIFFDLEYSNLIQLFIKDRTIKKMVLLERFKYIPIKCKLNLYVNAKTDQVNESRFFFPFLHFCYIFFSPGNTKFHPFLYYGLHNKNKNTILLEKV